MSALLNRTQVGIAKGGGRRVRPSESATENEKRDYGLCSIRNFFTASDRFLMQWKTTQRGNA